MHSRIFDYFHI